MHVVEVSISSDENQVMLDDKSRNPKIVGGDGRAGLTKLRSDSCVMVGCFSARAQNVDTGFGQENLQITLVLGRS
jgi:hypothetical protein